MKKFVSKITFITILVFSAITAKAQLGYEFSKVDLGAAVGFNQVFGAAPTSPFTESLNLNLSLNPSPFVNVVLEGQFGTFEGGSLNTFARRKFAENFNAYTVRFQLQAGEFIDYETDAVANALKNFYIASGIGVEFSQVTSINRIDTYGSNNSSPGPNNTSDVFIPFRVGYEFKIFNKYGEPATKIDISGNYNLVLNNDLDGYIAKYSSTDVYTQITVGVKFAIGNHVSYKKQIQY